MSQRVVGSTWTDFRISLCLFRSVHFRFARYEVMNVSSLLSRLLPLFWICICSRKWSGPGCWWWCDRSGHSLASPDQFPELGTNATFPIVKFVYFKQIVWFFLVYNIYRNKTISFTIKISLGVHLLLRVSPSLPYRAGSDISRLIKKNQINYHIFW